MAGFAGAKIRLWFLAMLILLGVHMANAARVEEPDYTNSVNIMGDTGNTVYQSQRPVLPAAAAKPFRWRGRGVYCADRLVAADKPGFVMRAVSNIAQTLGDTSDIDGVLAVAQDMAIAVAQTADGGQAAVVACVGTVWRSRQSQEALALAFGVGVALALCLACFGCCCILLQHYRLPDVGGGTCYCLHQHR